MGHTKNYLYVAIDAGEVDIKDRIVGVKIKDTKNEMVIGDML